jgi:hypothetical protein
MSLRRVVAGTPLQPLLDEGVDLLLSEGAYDAPLVVTRSLRIEGEPGAVIDAPVSAITTTSPAAVAPWPGATATICVSLIVGSAVVGTPASVTSDTVEPPPNSPVPLMVTRVSR